MADKPYEVVADSEATGRRVHLPDLTAEELQLPFKVNDLYLMSEHVRSTVLSQRLGSVLAELLGETPVVCNTLSVEYGTQQADHLDTLYMTPRSPGALIATWIALEDVHPDAGPLRFYPGSNHIAPYMFEDSSYHFRDPEMEQWQRYMATAIERRGLTPEFLIAKKGDIFIWDAWLVHGGSEIVDTSRRRKSIITHYYSESDCVAAGYDLAPAPGGRWWKRDPQPVPSVATTSSSDVTTSAALTV